MLSTTGFWVGQMGHSETIFAVFFSRRLILLMAAFSFIPASLMKIWKSEERIFSGCRSLPIFIA
jgi:hypothetical protein